MKYILTRYVFQSDFYPRASMRRPFKKHNIIIFIILYSHNDEDVQSACEMRTIQLRR